VTAESSERNGAERLSAAGHAALVLPALLLLGPDLAAGRMPYLRDFSAYFAPYRLLIARALREGRLPQWNPLAYEGHPLLVDPNYSLWHPFAWLVALLPDARGLVLFVLATALLGAYGAVFLAGRAGLGRSGRIVAGACFAWSGTFVSLQETGPSLALAAVPWTVGAFLGLARSPGALALAGAAAATAQQLASGTPEIGACAVLLAIVAAAAVPDGAPPLRRLAHCGGALALGIGAASVQWIPTLLFLRGSTRSGGWSYAQATQYSLHPLRLLDIPFPFAAGDLDALRHWSAFTGQDYPWVEEIYAGLVPLALAAAGAAAWKNRAGRAIALACAALLVPAMGAASPVSAALWRNLGALRLIRFPEKFAIPLAVAVALLAGAGWEAVARRGKGPGALLGAAAAGACAAACAVLRPERGFAATALGAAAGEFAALAVFLGALAWKTRKPESPALLLAGAVIAVDLLVPALRMHHTIAGSEFETPPAVESILREDAEEPAWAWRVDAGSAYAEGDLPQDDSAPLPLRLFRLRHTALFGARPMLDGLQLARGYSGFTSAPVRDLFQSHDAHAAMSLLGIRYGVEYGSGTKSPYPAAGFRPFATLPGPVRVWRNPSAGPKATVTDLVLREAPPGGVPSCAGGTAVWLRGEDLLGLPPDWKLQERCPLAPHTPPGSVQVRVYEPERVLMRAVLERRGIVLLADAAARGWSVTVDGLDATALAADGALRAVVADAGTHVVEWRYRTPGLLAGAAVSGATVVGLLALVHRGRRRAKA